MGFSHLFSPGRIGELNLKNRIIMPLYPTKYGKNSRVTEQMMAFYRARAKGGVGLIVLDCPCLDYPTAFKGGHQLRFDTKEFQRGILDLVRLIHDHSAKAFMHLNYLKEIKASSHTPGAKKKKNRWMAPLGNVMSLHEAEQIRGKMAAGAKMAKQLEYDGVEIQASYGGLIAQLLSPWLNKRTDKLGGNFKNRISFLTQLIKDIKKETGPQFPIMVKLVCNEFIEGGITIKEGIHIAKEVEKAGADAIVANGGNKATKHLTIPGQESSRAPMAPLAFALKSKLNIPVIAIGKIGDPGEANDLLAGKQADYIAMARGLVADPDWPVKAKTRRADEIRHCVYCLEDCADKGVKGIGRCCAINPFAGLEHEMKLVPATQIKKVLVVGGGPAGIQAALTAQTRGHDVTLWEKEQILGGQGRLIHMAPFKDEMKKVLTHLIHTLKKSRVKVKLFHRADFEKITKFNPDTLIIATGSCPVLPKFAGINQDNAILARDIYEGAKIPDKNILIIGGGDVGCETAEWLTDLGKQATIVELLPKILNNMKNIPKKRLMARLTEKGVKILTGTRLIQVDKDCIRFLDKDDKEFEIQADRVVIAMAGKPENSLVNDLENVVDNLIVVGDAAELGNLGSALRSGTKAALSI
ncbi:MAG: FAD-dependent oxidoreductase [Desulfobacteraceae bacterium]|nr:FAD-dependent oxidoreductase [Desulfobacteraceae bacterium]